MKIAHDRDLQVDASGETLIMNRREAIRRASLLLGFAIIGGEAFVTGCRPKTQIVPALDLDPKFLNEVGEIIIPTTDTPGARAADVGAFIRSMVSDCLNEAEQRRVSDGVREIIDASKSRFGREFLALSATERLEIIAQIDRSATSHERSKAPGVPPHPFFAIKQLVVVGYLSSEVGRTQFYRYAPIPGRYGDVAYQEGDPVFGP